MIGAQTPRIQVEPARAYSDGTLAAMLMEAYGRPMYEWQRLVVDCWLGRDADGNYSVLSAGLASPRQNGKNVCLEAREFFGLVVRGEKILHTAHESVTAKKSWKRMAAMFSDRRHPEIQKLVRYIRRTNGEEAVVLENGGAIEYSTRTREKARGFDGVSLIVYDEAQELTDDQVEAIMAVASSSETGERQILYTGTPPYPNCPGTVFRKRRQICLDAPGEHDAWHEWSIAAESVAEIRADDRTLWYMSNPSLGYQLSEAFTAEEQRTMSADGFARERLGWWSPVLTKTDEFAIPADAWDACASAAEKPEGKTAYGVKFTPDGAAVALCGAVLPKEGPARVSLIEMRPTGHGTQWLADWLNARAKRASVVVIDGRNGADVLVEKISGAWKAKDSVKRPTSREVVAAVSTLTNAVSERTLSWYDKQPALRESAVTAVKRPLAGGWAFGGENSAPIEAAALALWGARTSKRDPTRRQRVG